MTDIETSGKSINTAGERRRQAILDAAWSLFREKGYAAVSVDEIISVSGGSKSTFYKIFGSKEGILKILTESFAEDMIREMDLPFKSGQTARERLRHVGLYVGKQALSEFAVSHHRLAVANARDFPEIARLWYDFGPGRTMKGMADYLQKETEAGRLKIVDPERAATFFLAMVIFKNNMTMLIGAAPPSSSELESIVDEAVNVFLAAYGKPES